MNAAIEKLTPYVRQGERLSKALVGQPRRSSGFWSVLWLIPLLVFSLVGCSTKPSQTNTGPKPEAHPQPDVGFPPIAPTGMAQP
jgi:hypothetical protein